MPPFAAAVIALIGLVVIFSAVWAWQLKTENAGMVDPVWAFSLGLVAVFYAVLGTGDPVARALTALGGLVWGVRLGTHLWRRNFGQPEDARYHRFREEWGDKAASKMFWFFQLQVVISMLLSIAFLVPSYRGTTPAIGWIVLAVAVWIVSVAGEAMADRQLQSFKADPGQSRRGLPRRLVALLAASELLLRMRALGGLYRAVGRHAVGLVHDVAAGADGVFVAEALRHSAARRKHGETAPGLRRLHAHHQRADSVAAAALNTRPRRTRAFEKSSITTGSQPHERIHYRPHAYRRRLPSPVTAGSFKAANAAGCRTA